MSQKIIDDFFNDEGKRKSKHSRSGSRDKNVKIWKNTQHIFTNGRFKKINPPPSHGISHKWDIDLADFKPIVKSTTIRVWNQDTLHATKQMQDEGLNPLVLNMASTYCPGGGVRKGAQAQEECLFRQTNYFLTLDKEKLPPNMYPLQKSECIYSPKVFVVKDSNGQMLKEHDMFYCDFIAQAAIRRPKVNNLKTEFRFDDDREETLQKIEKIYQVGLYTGHTDLLLGALGCGAYYNPPGEIVEIFRELNEKYNGYFNNITFAVLSHSGNPNYDIFTSLVDDK